MCVCVRVRPNETSHRGAQEQVWTRLHSTAQHVCSLLQGLLFMKMFAGSDSITSLDTDCHYSLLQSMTSVMT